MIKAIEELKKSHSRMTTVLNEFESIGRLLRGEWKMNRDVMVDLEEWSKLITELTDKEIKYYDLKEKYNGLSENIIASTDFKELYGKNNETVRKNHIKKDMMNWRNY